MRAASGGGGTVFLGQRPRCVARSQGCWFVLTYAFLPNVSDLMATASVTVPPPRVRKKIAATRNDPKRGAHLQGAPRASPNRRVPRTDRAGSRRAPSADRERRPPPAPAPPPPTPSGAS